jgi:putative two-component system response regulator
MERVLVVDDERDSRYALADALASKGFDPDTAEDGCAALERVERDPSFYGLVYSDIQMPRLDGFGLIERVSGMNPTIVSILTGSGVDADSVISGMRAGAFDYLNKPFSPAELEISLIRATERRRMLIAHYQERERLLKLVEVGQAEKRMMAAAQQEEKRTALMSSMRAHARTIEAKDPHLAGHSERVARYAEILARRYGGFDDEGLFNLKAGALLHDIGNIGVPSEIFGKKGPLEPQEQSKKESHPAIGGRIVRLLHGFNLEPIVRHHHERFDGTGYPWGLKGGAIPLESRLILIADAFDAMTTSRPYRQPYNISRVLDELENGSGSQFDPDLVDLALLSAEELEDAHLETATKKTGDYFN